MEIKRGIISKYLNEAFAYVGDKGCEPDNITEYHDSIINMKKFAAYDGNLDVLLLGIDCLLLDPNLDAPSFAEIYVLFDADEMEELLRYIRSVAFPDAPPLNPETIKDVELV
jgi:hypothetical protein